MEFLHKVAKEIYKPGERDYSNVCVVFPHKRAGIYFKKELAELSSMPVWSPKVYSINEFISELSELSHADELNMIFELFMIFKKHKGTDNFEKFYKWGRLMLDDFNEIDRYLVDKNKLFRNLKDLKDIDNNFCFDPSENEYFVKFWKSFSNEPLNDVQQFYINIWENMSGIFSEFRQALLDKKLAYDGLMYSEICRKLEKEELNVNFEKVIFAGFNLITPAEMMVMKAVRKIAETEFYWNADEFFINDEDQEAGYFLRKNIKELDISSPKWIDNSFLNKEKDIKITGVSLKAGQAKALGNELENLNCEEFSSSVIILPDESLLLPVLYSLPDSIKDLNITMGYPLSSTPLFHLIRLIRNLHKPDDTLKKSYYYKDVISLLSHPYIEKVLSVRATEDAVNKIISENIIYLDADSVKTLLNDKELLLSDVLECYGSPAVIIKKLFKVFDVISDRLEKENEKSSILEVQYFYYLYSNLKRIKEIFILYEDKLEIDSFWNVLIEVLSEVRIPFTGEPLKGIQIMGILEARNLDFKNVYILSLNEGSLPKAGKRTSLIPFNLRKAFGLPVFEHDDALSANYFYSTIPRADNIHLFYNTQEEELFSGDISRYVLQLEKEIRTVPSKIMISQRIAEFDYDFRNKKEITITKTDDILKSLSKISATQLNVYINCPLQFYLKQIAYIREPDSVEEDYTAATFGNILHIIMKNIYTEGNVVTAENIQDLQKQLSNEKEFDKIFNNAVSEMDRMKMSLINLKGHNLLFKSTIKRLLDDLLKNDLKDAPFKIIGLEKQYEMPFKVQANGQEYDIIIKGKIDRIDKTGNVYRIIDYKTGGKMDLKLNSKESYQFNINNVFENVSKKEVLQTMFYAYLFRHENPEADIISGIYAIRKLKNGIIFPNKIPFKNEEFQYFEEKLKEKIGSIFDKSNKFIQSERSENCTYCSYSNFCYR